MPNKKRAYLFTYYYYSPIGTREQHNLVIELDQNLELPCRKLVGDRSVSEVFTEAEAEAWLQLPEFPKNIIRPMVRRDDKLTDNIHGLSSFL